MPSYCPLPTNKLIRWKIPSLQEQSFGVKVTVREIDPRSHEAQQLLALKLQEEMTEVEQAPREELYMEVADLREVLNTIYKFDVRIDCNLIWNAANLILLSLRQMTLLEQSEVEAIQEQKTLEKGDFSKLTLVISEERLIEKASLAMS